MNETKILEHVALMTRLNEQGVRAETTKQTRKALADQYGVRIPVNQTPLNERESWTLNSAAKVWNIDYRTAHRREQRHSHHIPSAKPTGNQKLATCHPQGDGGIHRPIRGIGMRDRIIRVTGLILALTGLVLLLVGAHEGRGEPMLGGMYCFTVGVLLPSTTYQEDPDQEDQEEPKGD